MIGRVENDEPIPIVTMSPTRSMANAAIGRLSANTLEMSATRGLTSPVASITAAKPWAEIMMNPMTAIIFIPWVKTSSASRQGTAPVTRKTINPTRDPMSRPSASAPDAFIHSCTPKHATIPTSDMTMG